MRVRWCRVQFNKLGDVFLRPSCSWWKKAGQITVANLRGAWSRQDGHLDRKCLKRTQWLEVLFGAKRRVGQAQCFCRQAFVVPHRVDLVRVSRSSCPRDRRQVWAGPFLCVVGSHFLNCSHFQLVFENAKHSMLIMEGV